MWYNGATGSFRRLIDARHKYQYQSLHTFNPWHKIQICSTSPERPKVLFKKGYGISLLRYLVHLLPLGTTVFVLLLNFQNVYWTGTNTSNLNSKLNALQFAAKFYEILISASITSILIDSIRNRLIDEGIPLGSLVSSFNIGQINCLWSPAFWGGVCASPTKSSWWYRFYDITLGISIILMAVIGPFMAIALIPKVDWWLRSPKYLKYTDQFSYSIDFTSSSAVPPHTNALRSQIWPVHLTESNLPTQEGLSSNAIQNSMCPLAGYSTLLGYASKDNSFASLAHNVTMPGDSQSEGTRSIGCETEGGYLVSSSISQLLAQDIKLAYLILGDDISPTTLLMKLSDLNNSRPLKPVVQTQCELHNSSMSLIEFPNTAFAFASSVSEEPTNNTYANESWTMDMGAVWNTSYLEGHIEKNSVAFTWVKPKQYDNQGLSIAASMAVPPTFIPNADGSLPPPMIYACSLVARWLPAELWITPTLSDSYYESIPNPLDLLQSTSLGHEKEEPIDISLEWASALNVPVADSPLTTIETLLNNTSGKFCDFSGPDDLGYLEELHTVEYIDKTNLAAILAVLTVDGLARVGLNYDLYVPTNSTILGCALCDPAYPSGDACDLCGNGKYSAISNSANWTSWKIDYYQYEYGYGITNITTRIAITVLILYRLIAIAATINIIVRNCNSSSWSSLGELLALATNSPPSAVLRNTGAGIGRLNTWKEVVRVRATEEEQLMMIYKDHEGSDKCSDQKPKVREKYE